MNIELKHIRAFAAVAKHRHFTRAAEDIRVSQPTLTLLIQQLEDAVGVALVRRSTRHVELTEMGREFLPAAQTVVDDLARSVESLRNLAALERGKVTIAALPSVCSNLLPEIVVAFMKAHPEVTVRIIDAPTQPILDAVRSGTADFGLGYRPEEERGLAFRILFEDEMTLIVRNDHALAGRPKVRWRDLKGERIVSLSDVTSVRRIIDKALAARGIELAPILDLGLMSSVIALVLAGAGPGILPSSYVKSHPLPGIRGIRVTDPVVRRPIGLMTRANRVLTPAAAALHGAIVSRVAAVRRPA